VNVDPTARVRLGRTGLTVTRLGLGLAPLGGLYQPIGDETALATVNRAWDLGLRFFDTAPLYGHGLSERRVGAALASRPRAEFVLATKVGRVLVPGTTSAGWPDDLWPEAPPGVVPRFDFSASGVRQSHADSLARLGLDRVDVLHLHDPDDHYKAALTQAYPALADLRAAGAIGAVGAGMNQAEMLARLVREAPAPGLDCLLLAGRYTLLDQSGLADLLPLCASRGVAVIAAGVYNSGLLADPSPGAPYNYRAASPDLVDRALALRAECDRHGVPLRAAAIQFPLAHPAVTTVVVGANSPEQVEDAVAMFRFPVPAGFWSGLKSAGLLPEHVPVPT
jgi:aryl-alcohol dehydrogenase-like predicted oxidoreductase